MHVTITRVTYGSSTWSSFITVDGNRRCLDYFADNDTAAWAASRALDMTGIAHSVEIVASENWQEEE